MSAEHHHDDHEQEHQACYQVGLLFIGILAAVTLLALLN